MSPRKPHPKDHIPDWESGDWGVIVGVAKCRICGRVSTRADFLLRTRQ